MFRYLTFWLLGTAAFAQAYRTASTGAPPSQLAPGIQEAFEGPGVKVVDSRGFVFCEVWLRSAPLADSASMEDAIRDGTIPQGALVGVVRFASPGADRQGQGFGPGLYTLRQWQDASVLMVRAADDQELSPPDFDQLAALSRKVSKTATPAALRLSKGGAGRLPRFEMTRRGEWIMHTKLGETPVALLVVESVKAEYNGVEELMRNTLLSLFLLTATAFGQYKLEPAGAPPSELTPTIREALQKDGAKIIGPKGSAFCEVWLRSQAPTGAKSTEQNVSFTQIPHGSLLGVIRFPAQGADRRGQLIKPGLYTLRLSFYPPDGDHQGVAPQRDFLLMVPAADDTDLNATPNYDQLVKMSTKASGTSHPAVLSIWKPESPSATAALSKEGEDWVLKAVLGGTPIAVLVVGAYSG